MIRSRNASLVTLRAELNNTNTMSVFIPVRHRVYCVTFRESCWAPVFVPQHTQNEQTFNSSIKIHNMGFMRMRGKIPNFFVFTNHKLSITEPLNNHGFHE